MDVIASAVENKIISEDVYRDLAVKTTKCLLESYGYECGETIGEGTFGQVIEVENKGKSTKVAAKIVLDTCATKSETVVWPKLASEYVLPLLGQVKFQDSPAHVFFSPLCQGSLAEKLEEDKFFENQQVFKVVKKWLRNIVSGVADIHGENMCHLDLKLTNVLIKKNGKACICDLGCVCSAEKLVDSYASPLFYRAPEAQITREGQTAVNGIKYDVWTLGVLALEMFTRKLLSETLIKTTGGRIYSWVKQIYPIMFQILQDKNFEVLVQRSSPKYKLSRKKVAYVRNFITSCLNPDPEARPSCSDLLNHKLFGGSYKYIAPTPSEDIWDKYTCSTKLDRMVSRYTERTGFEMPRADKNFENFNEGDHEAVFAKVKYIKANRVQKEEINHAGDNPDVFAEIESVKVDIIEKNENSPAGDSASVFTEIEDVKVDVVEREKTKLSYQVEIESGDIVDVGKKKKGVFKWLQDKFTNFRRVFKVKKS